MGKIYALGQGGTSVMAPFVGPAVRMRHSRHRRPAATRRRTKKKAAAAPRRRKAAGARRRRVKKGKRGQKGGGFNPLSLLPMAAMML